MLKMVKWSGIEEIKAQSETNLHSVYFRMSTLTFWLESVFYTICKSTSHHTEDDNLLTATAIPSTSTTISTDQVQTDFRGNLINPTTEYYHDHQPTVRQSSLEANDGVNKSLISNSTISPIGSKIEGIYSDDYEDNDESMWLDLGAYSGDHGSYGWYVDHPVGD
uniref:Uncharacterized protein n=1 Tax=Tetranychus urticae TaxID=32264 RepID=T1KWW5_TETUR